MNKEIGSFIEFDLPNSVEFYNEDKYGQGNICRLNSCRSAIVHAIRLMGVKIVYLPLYECNTVYEYVEQYCNVQIIFYKLDSEFNPLIYNQIDDSAVVICNYFGIFGIAHFDYLRKKYRNIIVDNAQAFYAKPFMDCYNCYSPRKFFGVPDGGYVVGNNANKDSESYPQDYSSDSSIFLLQRIEYGCTGKAYDNKKANDQRIDISGEKKMSILTKKLLGCVDYSRYSEIRRRNFNYAREYLDDINIIHIDRYLDDTCFPYVYPLFVKTEGIIERFHQEHIYQGHWWEYLVDKTEENSLENELSRFIVPITIDHRYCKNDIIRQIKIVKKVLHGG